MKIHPLFKWFGSKWQSARYYPIPIHDTIWEPFAGGAGYSLNFCDKNVYLLESNPRLISLWRWIIDVASTTDVMSIPVDVPIGTDIRSLGLTDGQALLLKNWQRTNNVGECWTISPWGNLPGQWTRNTRDRVSREIHAVKHWKVGEIPTGIATWFVDPPYQRNYDYGSPTIDYVALGELCRRSHSVGNQVIVCEALGKKGERPDWLPFHENHRSVTSRRKSTQSHHSREFIWTGS